MGFRAGLHGDLRGNPERLVGLAREPDQRGSLPVVPDLGVVGDQVGAKKNSGVEARDSVFSPGSNLRSVV